MSSTLTGSPPWWQAEGIYSSPRLPLAPTWLVDSHLQEGHFLTVLADLWVGWSPAPSHTSELINTSSLQLGLEIRTEGDEAHMLKR